MKTTKILYIFLLITICMFITSCSKDDDIAPEEPTVPSVKDEYYVHYLCSVYSTVSYRDLDNSMKSWGNRDIAVDVAIGPVSKGFEARLEGTCGLNGLKNPTARIQISKNGGPWIDKQILNIREGKVSLSYIIDF